MYNTTIIGFSANGKFNKISLCYSTLIVVISSAKSAASMVKLFKMVSFQDLQETASPTNVNTYTLVALISSISVIHLSSLLPYNGGGYSI